mgnify:CR=1 FL=1
MNTTAFIDGKPCSIEDGETLLKFIERHAGRNTVPTLCNDSRLEPFGACRVCSVEVATQPDGPRRVVASCHTPVTAGLHVFPNSPRVLRLRRNLLELVLSDYPPERLAGPAAGDDELRSVLTQVNLSPADVRYAPGRRRCDRGPDTSHPYLQIGRAHV